RPEPVAALGGARGLRVGLAWRGNPQFASDFARSLPGEALAPFRDVARCSFFSLMAPEHSAAIAAAGHGDWLTDLAPVTSPFEDLARVVAGLDVVVTICTSVAHLAGAMGKPTFLMLSRTPDWRWGREGAETPWYPSVRIFRQRRFGRWGDVIADVAAALGAL
ncbi:MAG: glycosyltransferase family 9 protein, partial [Alphaproteobacteria bacterium]